MRKTALTVKGNGPIGKPFQKTDGEVSKEGAWAGSRKHFT